MRVRRRRYEREPERQRRLSRPVISVGNLSMGGTGKTPVVLTILQWLLSQQQTPSVLTRGYGRGDAPDGVVIISSESPPDVERAGDEPVMLARSAPGSVVCVSPDRFLGGRLAEQLGCTVHVLDDGFQHLELARDLDVLVTTVGEIAGGRLIPFGRLRESREAAQRADVVIVSGATPEQADAEARSLGVARGFAMTRRLDTPRRLGGSDTLEGSAVKVMPVAGIANPERFAMSLGDAGYEVVDPLWFRDHHRYTTKDAAAIAARFRASGAVAVVTTSKDAVRFEALGAPAFPLFEVPLRVDIDRPDEFFDALSVVLPSSFARSGEPGRGA